MREHANERDWQIAQHIGGLPSPIAIGSAYTTEDYWRDAAAIIAAYREEIEAPLKAEVESAKRDYESAEDDRVRASEERDKLETEVERLRAELEDTQRASSEHFDLAIKAGGEADEWKRQAEANAAEISWLRGKVERCVMDIEANSAAAHALEVIERDGLDVDRSQCTPVVRRYSKGQCEEGVGSSVRAAVEDYLKRKGGDRG